MLRLMDPLEADGLVISEMVGSIRLYRLIEAPWTSALTALVDPVLAFIYHSPAGSAPHGRSW